jgi:hypothetical protein
MDDESVDVNSLFFICDRTDMEVSKQNSMISLLDGTALRIFAELTNLYQRREALFSFYDFLELTKYFFS